MPLDLEQLAQLVNDVARERQLKADIVGVVPTEGEGCYAEVILNVGGRGAETEQISLGLHRDAALDELREQIDRTLAPRLNRNRDPQ